METDEAGPSGSNVAISVTEAEIAAADRDFCNGLQALRVIPFVHLAAFAKGHALVSMCLDV